MPRIVALISAVKGGDAVRQHTSCAVVATLVVLAIALNSGPATDDTIDEQTEQNRNSPSVVTLPAGGPITVF